MATKPLSEGAVKALKPKAKPYKVADGGGLYVLVTPAGGKLWRLDYRHDGKRKTLALGQFPAMSVAIARGRREDAKEDLRAHRDPARPVAAITGDTFKEVAKAWHASQDHRWTPAYAKQVLARLDADIFPDIGARPIASISRSDVLATLRKVEERGVLETTRRLKQYVGAIFRFAAATDDSITDPTAMLKGALKAPPKPKHHKALKRGEIGDFILRLNRYDGEPETRLALKLTLLTAVRTTETRGAMWSEFENLNKSDKAVWRIPAERMKMRTEHLVPLSPAAVEVLTELRKLTGKGEHLFPDAAGRGRIMSNNTMLFACYRLGYRGRLTVHGFRRTFSTEANEAGFPPDHIEMQLAHDERDRVRSAYNAAKYLEGRRKLMDWWATHLDKLRRDARIDVAMSAE